MANHSLPEVFLQRLREIVPAAEVEACIASFSLPRPTCFRVNTLKTGDEDLREELIRGGFRLQPVPWRPATYQIESEQRRALTESAAFHDGRLYIQNLSSMLAPMVLDPQPGEMILDLAAAPGGKTLQMAAMMNNQGQISAVESVKGRFFKLQANLARHGATLVKSYLMDGRAVGRKVPERFDRVLLDAPCSSEARFRTDDPGSWSHWNLNKVKQAAHKQKRLLDSAIRSLKPGGCLLYCTCSFSPEENERVVDAQLRRHGELFSLEPIRLPLRNLQPGMTHWQGKTLNPALSHALRVLPDGQMDGFFLCKLRKAQGR